MRKSFKRIGYLFMGLAALRVWFDVSASTLQNREFKLADTGTVWANFHRDSLLAIQPGIERYLSPWIWENLVFPILLTPLAPILLVIAIFFLIAGAPPPKLR